jgi:hypothetical protein
MIAAGLTVEVVNVSVTPPQASLFTGRQQQFSALVAGTDNTAVNWSVAPANGGSITSTGIYTAPGTAGTFQVIATSVEDNRKAGSSQVSVTEKPKEGKENKDGKDTGKEFVKEFDKIQLEKVTEAKLRDVIANPIQPLAIRAKGPAGDGQPFIRANERPALEGSVAQALPASAKVASKVSSTSAKAKKKTKSKVKAKPKTKAKAKPKTKAKATPKTRTRK